MLFSEDTSKIHFGRYVKLFFHLVDHRERDACFLTN